MGSVSRLANCIKLDRLFLAFALTITCGVSCAHRPLDEFDSRHAGAEAKNPSGISMTLDTADGKRSYPESEFIPLVIRYTSQTISRYKVETGLGMNAAAESTRLVSDESKPSPTLYPGGFACCGSRLEPLNLDPIVFKPFVKFRLQPGKRRVYVTADQVFPWDIQGESEEHGKALETTSNILSLDITPDPGWQKRELAAIREKCGPKPCP